MFLGTHAPRLDDKGRLILPAKFREQLEKGVVVTRGQERCLYVFPAAEFERLAEQLRQAPVTSKQARDYLRVFLSGASDEIPDKQGRITIPPAGSPPVDVAAAIAEANAKLPGLLDHIDPDHPGMHRTDTVDVVCVLSGRCVIELAGGDRAELAPGDIVVQNGTRHAWRVPYDAPCTLLCVSLGARRTA